MDVDEQVKRINHVIDLLTQMRDMIERNATAIDMPPEKRALLEQGFCTYCGREHGDSKRVRGMHEYCAKLLKRQIEAGELTDDEAVLQGLCTPRNRGGRKQTIVPISIESATAKVAERRSNYKKRDSKPEQPK